jgi:hypothetical protein
MKVRQDLGRRVGSNRGDKISWNHFPVCPSPVTWKIFYDAPQMRLYPVSTKLNNSQNEGAESATPVTLDTPIQARLS